MALKVLSYNVKGLNSIKKRWKALKEFKAFGADVIMVQETHFRPGASDPSGKAGVAVLIKRLTLIRILSSILDPHDWFVLLKCTHLNTSFNLANICAPNSGQIGFLTSF